MDQLAEYGNDSENENDEDDKTNDAHHQNLESCGKNFFGLAGNTSPVTVCETDKNEEQKPTRQVLIGGNSVEVPEGDFWADLSEAEILYNDFEKGPVKPQKRKFERPTRPNVSDEKLMFQSSCAKRLQRDKNSLMHPSADVTSQNSASSSLHCVSGNESLKSDFLQSDPKVKVYAVHPKIAPYLNHQQSSHCTCKESRRWAGHAGMINRIAWCRNPSFSHLILSASMDSTLRVWNAWGQQQPCVRTLTSHTKAVRDAQWSMDGRQILSCSYDRTAALTDVQTAQHQVQFDHSGFVSAGRFHPVTPHLITTGTTDSIQVWDIRHPQVPVRILAHKEQLGQVQDLMFSHNGQELFSCGDVVTRESADRSIMAWDFRTGVILSNQIFQERYTVTRLCMHPSYSQFLAQTQAGYIAVFSTQRPYKMNKNKRFEGHQSAGYHIGVSLSQDASIVYSGSSDGKLHCYNFSTGKKIQTLNCGQVLLDVAAHPVLPSVVAGATWDGDIVLFQ